MRAGLTVFVLYLVISWWNPLMHLVGRILGAAAPLFIGFVIAYVVNILMSLYERHYFLSERYGKWADRTRRPVCLTGAIVTVIGALALLLWIVLPQLAGAISMISKKIPDLMSEISGNSQIMDLLPEKMQTAIHDLDYNSLVSGIIAFLTNGANVPEQTLNLKSMLGSLSSRFMTGFMGFIFSIYILAGKERLDSQFRRFSRAYFSTGWVSRAVPVLSVANDCFHSFIVGQVTEAVVIGVLCAAGMWILRLPYAVMIGTVVGVTALIPVFGCYFGAAVGALLCLSVSPGKAVAFLVFIAILQQLEGNLIYPRVVGTSLGLPGIWVLAAVTVGGGFGGIIGMLFSVPIAATAYRLIREDIRRRETDGNRHMTAADAAELLRDTDTENDPGSGDGQEKI